MKAILVLCVYLVIKTVSSKSEYLTPLGNGKFKVANSNSTINYDCRYGGEPLAIWGVGIGGIVDSSKDLTPLYVKDGFTASNLVVADSIKVDTVEVGKLHVNVTNIPYGGLSYSLSRDETFYVDVSFYCTMFSNDDKYSQIVSNPDMILSSKRVIYPVPSKEFNFTFGTGYFIYENTKKIEVNHFVWDELTIWSDYFATHTKNIFISIDPYNIPETEDQYDGRGFWFCGEEEQPETDMVDIIESKFTDNRVDSRINSSNGVNVNGSRSYTVDKTLPKNNNIKEIELIEENTKFFNK